MDNLNCSKRKSCKYDNSELCSSCAYNYKIQYHPKVIKDGECLCMYCKKIITDKKIFPKKDNPKIGICFDCY